MADIQDFFVIADAAVPPADVSPESFVFVSGKINQWKYCLWLVLLAMAKYFSVLKFYLNENSNTLLLNRLKRQI